MVNLTRANSELLKRSPDECFKSLADLRGHCVTQRENSTEVWSKPQAVSAVVQRDEVALNFEDGEARRLNEWSFGQLCTLCGVNAKTINRLSPKTATTAIGKRSPEPTVRFSSSMESMKFVRFTGSVTRDCGTQNSSTWLGSLIPSFNRLNRLSTITAPGSMRVSKTCSPSWSMTMLGSTSARTNLLPASLSGTARSAAEALASKRFGTSIFAGTISSGIVLMSTSSVASTRPVFERQSAKSNA